MSDLQSPTGGPLAGLVVLDLTLALAGPLCTQRLGDMGADVIKIEGPRRPDFTRNAPLRDARLGGETTAYLSINRNKRSLALDLKAPEAQEIFYKLVESSDVVIQNFRPGVAERLGVSFERLKSINSRIVYVSISGYGDEGPMIARPGQDLLVQAFSGTTLNAGTADGLPHPAPIYVVDVAASHNACEAVLAGIIQRDRTGMAVEAKVSLLAAVLEIQIQEITTYLSTGRTAPRATSPYASTWMEPPYGIYKMADGHIAIAQADLGALAEALDLPVLHTLKTERPDPADSQAILGWRDQIYPIIAEKLESLEVDSTVNLLHSQGIWCGPVNDYAALAAHPQAKNLFAKIVHPRAGDLTTLAPSIAFSTQPDPAIKPAPALGEHTESILGSIGFGQAEISELRSKGIVA